VWTKSGQSTTTLYAYDHQIGCNHRTYLVAPFSTSNWFRALSMNKYQAWHGSAAKLDYARN